MASAPWLEDDRFRGRKYLPGLARNHGPIRSTAQAGSALSDSLRRRWAAHLGLNPADLLPCATAAEAWRLLCTACLLPGDVALLAEPGSLHLPTAVLAAGAAYLDLSRDGQGAIPTAAFSRARLMHPNALFLGERPSLLGTDDTAGLLFIAAEVTRLIDARHVAAWAGLGAADVADHATVICLRDPDAPATPLLHAVVCQPGSGAALSAIQGPSSLPLALLEAGLSALSRVARCQDTELAVWRAAMAVALGRFHASAADHPGAVVFPAAGTRAAIECRAGDAAALFESSQAAGLAVRAYGGHPMRNLLVCDLTS